MGDERDRVAVGIDLGTTYSRVGVWQHGRFEIIPDDQGKRFIPSYIAFKDLVVDDTEKQDAVVPDFDMVWPFQVVGPGDKPMIHLPAAANVFSNFLLQMKKIAEAYLGRTVDDAVVAVPARFSHAQREAMSEAGVIAGLQVMNIVNHTRATAIAYGMENLVGSVWNRNVLIFDLGGGTLDVSLVSIDRDRFAVISTAWDMNLGGEIDNRMVNHFVQEFEREHKKDISKDSKALRRLRSSWERAKRDLSVADETTMKIDSLSDGIDFFSAITRARFEEMNMDLFTKCIELVEECLSDARMKYYILHNVVLVGGSTRIPKVENLLRNSFNGKLFCENIDPDEAVAYGATVEAAIRSGDDSIEVVFPLLKASETSVGIETEGYLMTVMIPRNTLLPTRKEQVFTMVVEKPGVCIDIFQGEARHSKNNHFLSSFLLFDVPSCPDGVADINVCFDMDSDGNLKVFAEEMRTGKKHIFTRGDISISTMKLHSKPMLEEIIEKQRRMEDGEDGEDGSEDEWKEDGEDGSEDEWKEDDEWENKAELEGYMRRMRYSVRCGEIGRKMCGKVRQKIEKALDGVMEWLNETVVDDDYEFGEKREELEEKIDQILKRGGS